MENNKVVELLRKILVWQRLIGLQTLNTLLPKVLSNKNKRQVYEMTNGENSISQISQKVGVATGTISSWWNKWEKNGLVLKVGTRFKKIISVKDLGLSEEDNNG